MKYVILIGALMISSTTFATHIYFRAYKSPSICKLYLSKNRPVSKWDRMYLRNLGSKVVSLMELKNQNKKLRMGTFVAVYPIRRVMAREDRLDEYNFREALYDGIGTRGVVVSHDVENRRIIIQDEQMNNVVFDYEELHSQSIGIAGIFVLPLPDKYNPNSFQ